MMLTSIALIFMCAGSTDYDTVGRYISGVDRRYPYVTEIALILFTSGLLIKSGVLPFHFWVPDAYSSAPAPVSVLLAGIVTKASGVYAVIRLFRDVFMMHAAIGNVLIILGLASIVAGAFAAIGQSNMKRMLAYSSISQIGYIILGIGTGSPLGFLGALLHFFNHATFKSLLFVDSAAIEMQTGTTDMDKLGGIAEKMPFTGISSIVAFLSTAGIPPFSGFWSKLIIIVAAWQVSKASAVIALLAGVITLGYLLVLQKKVFFGKPPEEMRNVKEAGGGIKAVQILLSAINVAAGLIFPLVLLYFGELGLIGG
jgi:multicomponent Na+:H+ antiporter subunit D